MEIEVVIVRRKPSSRERVHDNTSGLHPARLDVALERGVDGPKSIYTELGSERPLPSLGEAGMLSSVGDVSTWNGGPSATGA